LLPILVPPTPRIKHIDFAEARRVDEIDAGRPAIELDRDGKVVDDLEERRRRWRRRCGLSKVLLISNAALRFDGFGFHVTASVESCERLVTRQLQRQLQSLPRRGREDIKPLLELGRPTTIPAKARSEHPAAHHAAGTYSNSDVEVVDECSRGAAHRIR
jgi:hypothetical protein